MNFDCNVTPWTHGTGDCEGRQGDRHNVIFVINLQVRALFPPKKVSTFPCRRSRKYPYTRILSLYPHFPHRGLQLAAMSSRLSASMDNVSYVCQKLFKGQVLNIHHAKLHHNICWSRLCTALWGKGPNAPLFERTQVERCVGEDRVDDKAPSHCWTVHRSLTELELFYGLPIDNALVREEFLDAVDDMIARYVSNSDCSPSVRQREDADDMEVDIYPSRPPLPNPFEAAPVAEGREVRRTGQGMILTGQSGIGALSLCHRRRVHLPYASLAHLRFYRPSPHRPSSTSRCWLTHDLGNRAKPHVAVREQLRVPHIFQRHSLDRVPSAPHVDFA